MHIPRLCVRAPLHKNTFEMTTHTSRSLRRRAPVCFTRIGNL